MNKLVNGTEYRATNEGFVMVKGKRTIFINAKSVNEIEVAKLLMTKNSFDKLFKAGSKIHALGNNVSTIFASKYVKK